ncbi:MAG: RNA polymerase sigma factor [Acidobacteriota bacterium]
MSNDTENREDLVMVARFKATGDDQYFTALFDRYHKRIYWIAYSIFHNPSMADDLVQETFARAFEKIASFDEQNPDSSFYAWLCMICRHACLDEVRKAKIRNDRLYDPRDSNLSQQSARRIDEATANAKDTNFRAQEMTVIFHRIDEELRKIPQGRRECWLLFYLDGYSYKEIADSTGLSFEEVKTNIRYVNRYLKRIFA